MKATIYCRASTDNLEREGTSLQTQLENCLTYCQDKGYDVSYRFSEAYSGLSLESNHEMISPSKVTAKLGF